MDNLFSILLLLSINHGDSVMSAVDDFLVDPEDAQEGVGYIKPSIEVALAPNKRQECRDILQEIKQFGISQRQIVYLIYLLALEVENIELMKGITSLIGDKRDNVPLTPKDKGQSLTEEKKLILPTDM